jgi:sigma-B regulation protein RsbU (phosphoserine phosphatase)
VSAREPDRRTALDAVPAELRAALRAAGRVLRLAEGEVLLRPGEPNDALHVVLEGGFDVRLEPDGGAVGAVGPGETIGEMSVIDGQPPSAWVVAAGPSAVLQVPGERVWSELLRRPAFARGLLQCLTARLRQTLERQATLDRVRKELRLAREIQASMLPPAGALFPDRADVDCAAAMDPAAEVGGDFYDAFFLDERRLFFAVGDVAGKGMAAALFMARALTLLRAEALRRRPLHDVLGRLNEALQNEQATFVALFCGVLDCWSGSLRYASGGGLAPLVGCAGSWRHLPAPRGLVVGAIPGFRYETGRARLLAGEALVVFTDGVTEAPDRAGELFGEGRLAETLRACRGERAIALVDRVREAVRAFAAGGRAHDDLTLLVVRRPSEDLPAGARPALQYIAPTQ